MPRFCTALVDGEPCDYRARPGQRFCYGHSPAAARPFPRCRFLNHQGEPCRSSPIHAQDFCFAHSPRNRRRRDRPTPQVARTRKEIAEVNLLESIGCHAH